MPKKAQSDIQDSTQRFAMTLRWTQTNAALDEFLELLSCTYCGRTMRDPVRLMMCGHTLCENCSNGKSQICTECRMPVRPNEMQRHHLVAELIHNCEIIKQAIEEINVEDMQEDASTSELESPAETVSKSSAKRSDGNNEEKDSPSATPGYREPSQDLRRAKQNEADTETPGYRDPTQLAAASRANDTVSETPGYRDTSQSCAKPEEMEMAPETLGYRDPTQIPECKKTNNLKKRLSEGLIPRENTSENRVVVTTRAVIEHNRVETDVLASESAQMPENFVKTDDRRKIVIPETMETSEDEQLSDTLSIGKLGSEKTQESVPTFGRRSKIEKLCNVDLQRKIWHTKSLDTGRNVETTTVKKLRRISEELGRCHSDDNTMAHKLQKNSIDFDNEKEDEEIAKAARTDASKSNGNKLTPTKLKSTVYRKTSPKKFARNFTRRGSDNKLTLPKVMPKQVNKRNPKGESILHGACVKGQESYVKVLLDAKANPNTKDNANWTPLQEAVALGHTNICKMLLKFGASPDIPGMDNRTPLHEAVINDRYEETVLLLKFKAKRNVYDKEGKRPLDYATTVEMRNLLENITNAEELTDDEAVSVNHALDQSIITPNAKVVVFPLNLSEKNKKLLMKIAPKLKLSMVTSFRSRITHIIVESNERNIVMLTYNVMLGILEGKWILNSQWIAIAADADNVTEIDFHLFEVYGAPYPETPERARINEEKRNPRLFNNCLFYFTIGLGSTWNCGSVELTKDQLTNLVRAGQGDVLKREPNPEYVKDIRQFPFHVAHRPDHSLHRCSHYIIYMPGKDEPRVKYNMPHIKALPLAWFVECIEKFDFVDPIFMGIY